MRSSLFPCGATSGRRRLRFENFPPALLGLAVICAFLLIPAPAQAQAGQGTTFQAPGAKIYYVVFGSGTATPLFVANGGPGFSHRYLLVSDAWKMLGQHRKIVMWDQRGTGRSGPLEPGESCTLADQIHDLDALRAHLGYDKIDLLGHSWGGFLAMAYAARYPQHIKRLILLDSAAPRWKGTIFLFHEVFPDVTAREARYRFLANLKEKGSAAARDEATRLYESMLFYSPKHRDEFLAKTKGLKEYYRVNRELNRDLAHYDLNPEIRTFRFPVLVACGRFDMNVAPLIAYQMHERIPGSKFFVFDKSGHMPFFEQPAEFVAVVDAFLSGRPLPR